MEAHSDPRLPESSLPAPVSGTGAGAAAQAASELRDYLRVSRQRRRVFPRAALVGLLAGLVAVLLRVLLAAAETWRSDLVIWARQQPGPGWVWPLLHSAAGALLSVLLVQRFAPEAAGSGIPHLKAVMHRLRELRWHRVLPVKFFGSLLALGSGLALGREGPTVQMGGAVGDACARWLKASARDRLVLIAAGAGAGLAAAFNAPLSGLVFVLEEVQRDFRPLVFGAALIAAAVADIVARLASGQAPVFTVPSLAAPPLASIPLFILLGGCAGLLGVVFNRGLMAVVNRCGRLAPSARLVLAAVVGGAAGLLFWLWPMAGGGGHLLAEQVLSGRLLLAAIPGLFLVRFLFTLASYGTGAPGGIFAPLLILGALLGLAIGQAAHLWMPTVVPQPAVFAVVGMAAYFTAIVRAPLTGILLILEMTGSYAQMLPLVVSCFAAYAVAEALRDIPIYEALLERDLLLGGLRPAYTEPIVVELTVEPGAPFLGRKVRDLALPSGCILVLAHQEGREWVPTAGTELGEHMRLTAVIAPEAADALGLLRRGCESAG